MSSKSLQTPVTTSISGPGAGRPTPGARRRPAEGVETRSGAASRRIYSTAHRRAKQDQAASAVSLTAVLQSSSVTLGLAITLAGQGLLSLPAGVAVMLGAEVGTCADTLVAVSGLSVGAWSLTSWCLEGQITPFEYGTLILHGLLKPMALELQLVLLM